MDDLLNGAAELALSYETTLTEKGLPTKHHYYQEQKLSMSALISCDRGLYRNAWDKIKSQILSIEITR